MVGAFVPIMSGLEFYFHAAQASFINRQERCYSVWQFVLYQNPIPKLGPGSMIRGVASLLVIGVNATPAIAANTTYICTAVEKCEIWDNRETNCQPLAGAPTFGMTVEHTEWLVG